MNWDSLNNLVTKEKEDIDLTGFNPYLANRFIYFSELYRYSLVYNFFTFALPKDLYYKLVFKTLPLQSKNFNFNYIKRIEQKSNFPDWWIDLIAKHFKVNKRWAKSYAEILKLNNQQIKLAKLYGLDRKKLKELGIEPEKIVEKINLAKNKTKNRWW